MKVTNEKLEQRKAELQQQNRKIQDAKDLVFAEIGDIDREVHSRKEKAIKDRSGVTVYESGDYCGMSSGKYQFYFGYEQQMCLKHDDCSCEDKEWCFVADVDGVEAMRIPESRLGQQNRTQNLLYGIGQFLGQLDTVE